MADREQLLASAAYRALSPGKRAWHAIASEIERCGTARISLNDFEPRFGLCRAAARFAVKELFGLGFCAVGTGDRRANVFALTDGWQCLDADEAKQNCAA